VRRDGRRGRERARLPALMQGRIGDALNRHRNGRFGAAVGAAAGLADGSRTRRAGAAEEGRENGVGVRVAVVVADDVDEGERAENVVQELARRRLGRVEVSPALAELEGLVLRCQRQSRERETDPPGEEGDLLDDGRLQDLAAGEDAPGDDGRAGRGRVGLEIAGAGDGVPGHMRVARPALLELLELLRRAEELEVGLRRSARSCVPGHTFW